MNKEAGAAVEQQKPGTGVDRTLIHGLLGLSPAERVQVMVQSARNVMALSERIRKP